MGGNSKGRKERREGDENGATARANKIRNSDWTL